MIMTLTIIIRGIMIRVIMIRVIMIRVIMIRVIMIRVIMIRVIMIRVIMIRVIRIGVIMTSMIMVRVITTQKGQSTWFGLPSRTTRSRQSTKTSPALVLQGGRVDGGCIDGKYRMIMRV